MADVNCSCPHCAAEISVDSGYAGQTVSCPQCSGEFVVPHAPAAAPAPKLVVPASQPVQQQAPPVQQQQYQAPPQQPYQQQPAPQQPAPPVPENSEPLPSDDPSTQPLSAEGKVALERLRALRDARSEVFFRFADEPCVRWQFAEFEYGRGENRRRDVVLRSHALQERA